MLRAFETGKVSIHETAEFSDTGRIHELAQEMHRERVTLFDAVNAALRWGVRPGDRETRLAVRDSKTETGVRSVFVPPWAAEAVSEHIEDHGLSGTDRLITAQRRTVQAEHNRACDLVGLPEYTIHDHRHTAAVALARAGMPLHILQRQLGRKDVEMTMKCADFHPEYSDVAPHFDEMGKMLGLYPDDGFDSAKEASGDSLGDTPSRRGENAGVEK